MKYRTLLVEKYAVNLFGKQNLKKVLEHFSYYKN